jgi:hypothetical protein
MVDYTKYRMAHRELDTQGGFFRGPDRQPDTPLGTQKSFNGYQIVENGGNYGKRKS